MNDIKFSPFKSRMYALASIFLSTLGAINTPVSALETARIALPILVSPDDASTQPKTTVQPMLTAPVDILGARHVIFRSAANVSGEIRTGKKGREISVLPSDILLEYEIKSNTQSFAAYCKAYLKRPMYGLICLADRDNNGEFDQVWLGNSIHPKIWVPLPLVQLQTSSNITQSYSVRNGLVDSGLQFGFSVTSAGGLENKRELHLQVTNGNEKVYIFYNRILGPGRSGSVDTTIFDSQIRLYGEDSKTVTYSIEKPLTQPSYNISHPGISQNVWIYVPR